MDKRFKQRLATIEKHNNMLCKVFECKIDFSHLSKTSIKHLSTLFTEAKWFYNYCLAQDDLDKTDTTIKQVPVKVKDIFENRNLSVLSSQMKQSVKTKLFSSLVSLKALKKNGHRVGRLKFKSKVNSIPLKQYGITYNVDFGKNRIRIQGLKQWMRVRGLKQVEGLEIANAVLVKKSTGYYIHITTFGPKLEKATPETSVGIDFGCQTQLTFSNGVKAEFQIPINTRIKTLDKAISRKTTDSKNKYKTKIQRQRAYEKTTNKKKDIRHKVVNAITKNFKYVCFQDESIRAWHSGRHGKKIQNSGIGGIISDLKHKSHTSIEVDRFFPSTQVCPECGCLNKLGLGDRVYRCECGYTNDRDVKSAICIEMMAMKNVPTEHRDFKAQENSTNTLLTLLSKIDRVQVSKLESMNVRSSQI